MDGRAPIRLLIALADGRDGAFSEALLIARIAPPYYLFKDHRAEVVLATSEGGPPALSPQARHASQQDALARRFLSDRNARDDLADTLSIDQIVTEDFDAAFCIGLSGAGQGSDGGRLLPVVGAFLASGKPVALVPGRILDLSFAEATSGLLILGDDGEAPFLAAHALLTVAQERRES